MSEKDWRIPSSALRQGLEMADLAAEKSRMVERASLLASRGQLKDARGIEIARLTGEGEPGWAFCAVHGTVHTVNSKTGEWEATGVCEHCRKGDWSPDTLRQREADKRAAEAQREFDERLAAVLQNEAREQAEARAEIDARIAAEDAKAARTGDVRDPEAGPVDTPVGSDAHAPVSPLVGAILREGGVGHPDGNGPAPAGPRQGPETPGSQDGGVGGLWVRLAGAEGQTED